MERIVFTGPYLLLTAMAGDLLVSFVLSLFYKGYSNLKNSISALGNPSSPVRIPFNIWMLIEGILFLLALPALYAKYHLVSGFLTVLLMVFIAVFAVGACIFTCFFSVNESKDVVTVQSKIHGIGSVTGFMLFLFVPLIASILSFKAGDKALGVTGIVCFILSLVSFSLFVMADKEEFKDTVINNEGLWQRVNLLFMYLPLALAAVRFMVNP